ncbi:hypothetical protein B296_00021419 [Ensete ventricosum]|uniref:Uncharacterized protein n=1 Tax=Ensete ventricosum TaxID=4639 RepID=A0A426XMG8_ENSVE|nr:hypothetical protein B296_00021419 [Ensete ventricosum]
MAASGPPVSAAVATSLRRRAFGSLRVIATLSHRKQILFGKTIETSASSLPHLSRISPLLVLYSRISDGSLLLLLLLRSRPDGTCGWHPQGSDPLQQALLRRSALQGRRPSLPLFSSLLFYLSLPIYVMRTGTDLRCP